MGIARLDGGLHRAESASTRTKAYDVFEDVLATVTLESTYAEEILTRYLLNAENKYREALLSCLADRETELGVGSITKAVAKLLGSHDPRTRRMAGLVLAFGGSAGESELGKGLDALPVEWAQDIRATLRLSA
jgi:hypothetical protein